MTTVCPNCNTICNLADNEMICCSCFYEQNNKIIDFIPCFDCKEHLHGNYDKINYMSDY